MHTHLLRLRHNRQQTLLSKLLFIFFFFLVSHPTASDAQCSNTEGCFPPIGNLAIGRTVVTDSECSAGATFCIHGTTDCSNVCNSLIHSISSVSDGNSGTAWISTIGPGGTNATLQLNFEEPVLFDRTSILWKSPRPQSMVLERSNDDAVTWEVYRYYSTSCQEDFEMTPVNTIPTTQFFSTDAICTPSQSAIFNNIDEEVSDL